MGLRSSLKKTFTTNKKNSTSGPAVGPNGEQLYMTRTDVEYYKPNEIPRSKYRGKVDPDHQASLQAFSMFDAFSVDRRRSSLALSGTFSPGGTKAQSAAASRVHSRLPSRRPSMSALRIQTDADSFSSGSTSREKSLTASTALDLDTASSKCLPHLPIPYSCGLTSL
jgi:hypothetical protein